MWLLPDDRVRARVEKRQYRSVVKHIFVPRRSGWVLRRPDGEAVGAALWYPPGTKKHSFRESIFESLRFLPAGIPHLGKAARLQRLVVSHWPRKPHWYLSVLSVSPESQRRGYGGALLRPGLEAADAQGLGCWLETQRESNIPFYHRFGFDLAGELEVEPGIRLWLMWRPPVTG